MPCKQSWITIRVKRMNPNILRNIENDFSATHWFNWGEVPPFTPIMWNYGHTERGRKGKGGREDGNQRGSREREIKKGGREESRERGGLHALEGRGRPIQRRKNTTDWAQPGSGTSWAPSSWERCTGASKRQKPDRRAVPEFRTLEESQTSGSEARSSGGLAKPHKTIIKE